MSLGQCNPQSKLLWHVDRLYQFNETGTTKPILFEIDPSNKCNQDCPWCTFSRLRSENADIMCYQTLMKLVDDLADMGVQAINWSGGGEPTVNRHLADIVFYIRNNYKHIDQGIFTNGVLLNKKLGGFLSKHLTWIRISLDGYDKESYAKSHGTKESAFDVVVENARNIASINKKFRCTLGIGFIINEHNWQGIEKAVLLAKDIGADYIQLKPVVYRPNEKQLSREMLQKFYDISKDMVKHVDDNFNVMVTHYRFQDMLKDDQNYGRNYTKCLSHHFQGAVGADAKVYICDHHKGEKDYCLGNLKDKSLKEIWNSPRRFEVIENLNKTDLSQCQSCCRNHETNKFLWHMKNKKKELHPNHI